MERRTKAEQRVLVFLSQHDAACVTIFEDDTKQMLRAASGSRLLTTADTMNAMQRAGTVALRGDVVDLTDTGNAAAKRASVEGDQPFAEQHRRARQQTIMTDDGSTRSVQVNADESPLSRLATRNSLGGQPYINEHEFEAGERLRRDFERAQLRQRITGSWDIGSGAKRVKGSSGGLADLSDTAIDARARFDDALSALGPDLGGVLQDVCCHLKGVEAVERERRWPQRSAKLMLRTGLSLLAMHYGTMAGSGRGAVRTRHWKA
ncbi:MAG: DUF6456 domain-containing protein [Pseudomonadota bacterium]